MTQDRDDTVGLRVADVSHAYGRVPVLNGVSLQVNAGEIHCLLGPSGSGKTTLLRLIAGLEKLRNGTINIFGRMAGNGQTHVPPEERSIGFVFQDYALFPHLSVQRNVEFGMKRQAEDREDPLELLGRVGMQDFAQAMPHTLSGGQQQRVALARALARQPRVMLLDEPFSGLDARLRDEIRSSTVKLLRKAGVATVMVTHDPVEAMAVADRISVIHDGRIEQTGEPEELYSRPVNHRVATSLGEANLVESVVQQGVVHTPLGSVAASRFQEGDQVAVLFRPESLSVTQQPEEDSTPVKLRDVRFLGDRTRVEVETECGVILFAAVPMQQAVGLAAEVHLAMMATPAVVERNDNAASKHAS